MHIRSENEPIRSNHGCIKPGFSTNNYSSVDLKNHLKWHVFADNVGSVFCYVFGILVNYNFDTSFFLDSLKHYHVLDTNFFVLKVFSKSFVWIIKLASHSSIAVSILWKFSFTKLKNKKCFIIISLINYRAPYYFCKSKKLLSLT